MASAALLGTQVRGYLGSGMRYCGSSGRFCGQAKRNNACLTPSAFLQLMLAAHVLRLECN